MVATKGNPYWVQIRIRKFVREPAGLKVKLADNLSAAVFHCFHHHLCCYAASMPKVAYCLSPSKGLSGIRNSSPN